MSAYGSARVVRAWPAIAMAVLLGGCAGLPPALPQPPALSMTVPLHGLPSGVHGTWPAHGWWTHFNDQQLDALVQQALTSSPDLAAAEARVRGAEALANMADAARGAQAGASASITRQRLSENGLIPPRFLGFTWYTQSDLGAQLRYSFDFWGKHRAELAGRIDQVRAARAETATVRLGLSAAIASAYFAWQTDRAQLTDAESLAHVQESLHAISAARVRQGLEPEDMASSARLRLAEADAQRAALAGATRTQQAVLAALVGTSPDQLRLKPSPLPVAKATLPADARLQLLARRPDLAALRWQVEAMGTRVKAARADFLPDLSLNAMAGFSSIESSKALALGSRVFNVGPALTLPLFDGGLLKARYGYSVAQLDEAAARYNQAVLDAARQVGVAVLDLQRIEAQRTSQQHAFEASADLFRQAEARLRQGLTDATPALVSRATWLSQHATLTALHGQQLGAEIALIQALGGGYVDDAASPHGHATNVTPDTQTDSKP